MDSLRIGRHINISKGFLSSCDYAKSIGCNIFQIFLGSPRQIVTKSRQSTELVQFGKDLFRNDMYVVVHGSYTINLCHPRNSDKFKASVKSLVQDLNSALMVGCRCIGVIIHMGKCNVCETDVKGKCNVYETDVKGKCETNQKGKCETDQKGKYDFDPKDECEIDLKDECEINLNKNEKKDKPKDPYNDALNNYVFGIQTALSKSLISKIILETGASQGNEVGSKLEDLATIYWKLKEHERERVMFCIDTCHIWASGYDISNDNGVKKFFEDFDEKIGIKKIACVHFNDSKNPLNSHVDRHADIGHGYIGIDGLKAVAIFLKEHNIPIIFETPLEATDKSTNEKTNFGKELAKVKEWLKISG